MNTYIVAIPSYQRAATLRDKTLKVLQEGGIHHRCIYIFVANSEEKRIYREILPQELYNDIIVGKIGITAQRQYISKYFNEGQHIVSIDDDVNGVFEKTTTSTLSKIKNLHNLFVSAFNTCKKEGLFLWGVYPVLNPFYMKRETSRNLKFILGTMYGFINRHDRDIIPYAKEKEDVELSILYYIKDGGVLRLNSIGIKTRFHNPNGGLGAIDKRLETNREAAQYLAATYPNYGKVWRRKNGMYEFRLHHYI